MKRRYPNYFPNFSCLAGSCPDTCCAGWVIDLDEETWQRYQELPGAFGEHVRAGLRGGSGCREIRRTDGRCCFLQPDGLCELVLQLGEAGLGKVCHLHPRFTEYYGSLREDALSLSCPAAATLILTQEAPATLCQEETDEPVQPNDLDYAQFLSLSRARAAAISLAQNRALPIDARLALLLQFGEKLQTHLNHPRRLAHWFERFSDAAWCARRSAKTGPCALSKTALDRLAALDMTAPTLREQLAAAHGAPQHPDDPAMLEQLLVYELYRFFLQAATDGATLARIQLAVVSVLAIRAIWRTDPEAQQTPARRAWLAHFFAREVEHADENLDRLFHWFAHDPCFSVRALTHPEG